jgi:hypothetical protein
MLVSMSCLFFAHNTLLIGKRGIEVESVHRSCFKGIVSKDKYLLTAYNNQKELFVHALMVYTIFVS